MIDNNGDSVEEWFEDQADDFADDVEKMIENVTEATLERAEQEVPVESGDLRDSLEKDENTVGSDLEYAPHVGLGTIYMDGTDYLWGPAEEEIKDALQQLAND